MASKESVVEYLLGKLASDLTEDEFYDYARRLEYIEQSK